MPVRPHTEETPDGPAPADSPVGHTNPHGSIRVPTFVPPARPSPEAAEYFRLADLGAYTVRERLAIRAADLAFYLLIAAIGPTVRWEFEGGEHLSRLYRAGRHAIYVFWHNRIFFSTWFWRGRKIVVMTSQSFDGEYIARFIQRFGYGAARGSSTRGGVRAFLGLERALRAGYDAAFTVDGPKGPLYEAKSGPIVLARRTGHAIVPMHTSSSGFFEIPSWDRFRIPRPFSRARVVVAEPIFVPEDATDAELERARETLQGVLDDMRARYD